MPIRIEIETREDAIQRQDKAIKLPKPLHRGMSFSSGNSEEILVLPLPRKRKLVITENLIIPLPAKKENRTVRKPII